MRRASRTVRDIVVALAVLPAVVAEAQGITRDNYLDFLPPRPRIVTETRATARLALYGDVRDSAYRDTDPVDGVDDSRARRLRALGELFSPLLRRNNFNVPRDLDAVLGPRHTLHIDSWLGNRRVASDSIVLGDGPAVEGAGDDALLGSLLHEFHPRIPRRAFSRAEGEVEKIFFFDMPGHDAPSWRKHFEQAARTQRTRIFLHPFIRERSTTDLASTSEASARYQLVLQFWFFYPFNDAVNAHEGDWEHINVLVTTRAAAGRTSLPRGIEAVYSADEITRVLNPSYPATDSLLIAAVEYFFHDSVVRLDYLALSSPPTARGVRDPRHVWEDIDFARRTVRERLTHAGGRLATHPVVYIGGNNKGPDELLALRPRFHGSFKRNSGGSYPFPGVWQTVGPMGVTEKLHGGIVPRLRAGASTGPWHELIDDPYFVHYTAADIALLPDWERLEDLVVARRDVRQRWSWLLLPVYWGFPATSSLGAGLIKHVDLGHVAVLSPTYHSTWNNVGESHRHRLYEPRVLRTPVSPTTPWAMLQSGWGVLNLPLAAWGLMPGYNVALIQLMPWTAGAMQVFGAPPGRTYVQGQLPKRFTTAGQGIFVEFGGRDFAGILPRLDPLIADFSEQNPGAKLDESTGYRRHTAGPRLWFNLYFRERFSLENTFSWATGDIGLNIRGSDGATLGLVSGRLAMRQLTGGIRYDLLTAADHALRSYARIGYGWLWYEGRGFVLRGAADARELQHRSSRGGYLPPILPGVHWWPNTWYGGAGAEVFSPQRFWLLGRLGYGLRAEFTELFTKLTFDPTQSDRGDVTARRGDLAFSLVFGW